MQLSKVSRNVQIFNLTFDRLEKMVKCQCNIPTIVNQF